MNKLTQEEVSKLSDSELNLAIYKTLGILSKALPNYCNNWNDLMPLVCEHQISLMFRDHKSLAPRDYNKSIYTVNENPQRALAECLLLALQEKSNNE